VKFARRGINCDFDVFSPFRNRRLPVVYGLAAERLVNHVIVMKKPAGFRRGVTFFCEPGGSGLDCCLNFGFIRLKFFFVRVFLLSV